MDYEFGLKPLARSGLKPPCEFRQNSLRASQIVSNPNTSVRLSPCSYLQACISKPTPYLASSA